VATVGGVPVVSGDDGVADETRRVESRTVVVAVWPGSDLGGRDERTEVVRASVSSASSAPALRCDETAHRGLR
jgi:hypothetical protein